MLDVDLLMAKSRCFALGGPQGFLHFLSQALISIRDSSGNPNNHNHQATDPKLLSAEVS